MQQARGPLMIEHRLIERMIALIRTELKEIETTQNRSSVRRYGC
jgi:hypothetical protein